MRKRIIAALALIMTFSASSCGNLGMPDPGTITHKENDGKSPVTTDDSSTPDEDTTDGEDSVEVVPEMYSPVDETQDYVKATLHNMTLEEKVGQLFFVRPDALETDYDNKTVNDDTIGGVTFVDKMMTEALGKYHVGGIYLYEKNISNETDLRKFTVDLQDKSELPLFIGVQELGGDYAPIANNVNFNVQLFKNMNELGKDGATNKAKHVGSTIGEYLTSYGVNIDFAPVADVSVDGEKVSEWNFSADATVVASLVDAEIDGFHEQSVMTAVGHFPGYADGSADKKKFVLDVNTWENLVASDLLPYVNILHKTDMLLVGHVELPEVITDGTPTSMSKEFIEGKIRDELGYNGVVITDTMSDAAVMNKYSQSECAVAAINAGADIILTPYDLDEAYNAVIKAVNDGTISESRIDESVTRVLTLKAKRGLFGTGAVE